MRIKMLGVAVAALFFTASAYANAIFNPGNHPQPNEEVVLLNGSGTVMGSVLDGHGGMTGVKVQFSSTSDTLIGSGGQSDVDAVDGEINNITITVPLHTFTDLIVNPFKEAGSHNVDITVHTLLGTSTDTAFGEHNGNNFMTITTSPGDAIISVTLDSSLGFQDLKQTRISGPFAVIPEPSSMLLLGSSVLILVQGFRRKLM